MSLSASLFSAYAPRKQQAVALLSYYSYYLCLHPSCKINLGEKKLCRIKHFQREKVTFQTPCLRKQNHHFAGNWLLPLRCWQTFYGLPLAPPFLNDQRKIFYFFSQSKLFSYTNLLRQRHVIFVML